MMGVALQRLSSAGGYLGYRCILQRLDSFGTAAWILVSDESMHMISRVVTPGEECYQSSYRSELAGLYSCMNIAIKLCQYYNILQGSIHLACDSESALEKAFYFNIPCVPDNPSFDFSVKFVNFGISPRYNGRYCMLKVTRTVIALLTPQPSLRL